MLSSLAESCRDESGVSHNQRPSAPHDSRDAGTSWKAILAPPRGRPDHASRAGARNEGPYAVLRSGDALLLQRYADLSGVRRIANVTPQPP